MEGWNERISKAEVCMIFTSLVYFVFDGVEILDDFTKIMMWELLHLR